MQNNNAWTRLKKHSAVNAFMKTQTTRALCLGLAIAFGIGPAFAQPLVAKWIGPGSCGSWTVGLTVGKSETMGRDDASENNAYMLSWILGLLSGQPTSPLSDVDVPSVASWLDKYCGANPLASLPETAFALRNEILKRRTSSK